MKKIKLENVFGVSKDQVLSYIERTDVDGAFSEALKSDKQIIVYGASKQGKSALVSKYLPYEDNIVVSCSPRSEVTDIYKSILRQLNIDIVTERQKSEEVGAEVGAVAKFKAILPLFASGEAEISTKLSGKEESQSLTRTIEFNLELPQDIFELYHRTNTKRIIILENFHYLDDEVQGKLAFDLRTFQELGLRFIVLGVWREKNRLVQYNGDLLDRIIEIPVEPWDDNEFKLVIEKGSEYLNIKISSDIEDAIIENSFGSIGVVQELIKAICTTGGIIERQSFMKTIDNAEDLIKAIHLKSNEYAARHIRALEDIAKGQKPAKNRDETTLPLYLPYYFVKSILRIDFKEILNGIERRDIEAEIKKEHHRKDDVRPSDMSNLLYNLAKLQIDKSISPPIFDYDRVQRTVKVIDSTFYFFLKNTDYHEILEYIPNPLE